MNTLVLFLLGLAFAVVAADKPVLSYGPPEFDSDEAVPPKYDFDWAIQDGESRNDFAHQETRDHDNTQGSYTVQLPDGRLQRVTYYVDGDSGFVAEVSYEGEARYPESDEYTPPRTEYGSP